MAVEVVLLKKVKNLGDAGEVVSVKEGYARNFLLTTDLAMLATPVAKEKAKTIQKKLETGKKLAKKELEKMAQEISATEIILKRKTDSGKLFGSVTDSEIMKLLVEKGIKVKKNQLVKRKAIKKIGNYEIPVDFSQKVVGTIKLKVVDEKK
ncbi:MAG: 50S ribosomal protein L9 [Patescibacteria group bacterium]|nr:50S ribosomal protein L9 [Patescibacteria group bacterium]